MYRNRVSLKVRSKWRMDRRTENRAASRIAARIFVDFHAEARAAVLEQK